MAQLEPPAPAALLKVTKPEKPEAAIVPRLAGWQGRARTTSRGKNVERTSGSLLCLVQGSGRITSVYRPGLIRQRIGTIHPQYSAVRRFGVAGDPRRPYRVASTRIRQEDMPLRNRLILIVLPLLVAACGKAGLDGPQVATTAPAKPLLLAAEDLHTVRNSALTSGPRSRGRSSPSAARTCARKSRRSC